MPPSFLRNPRPLFICDACGWRKVVHSRFNLANKPSPETRYAVEVLGDPDWYYVSRRLSRDRYVTISVIRLYTETRLEAEQFGRRLHNPGGYYCHYRINDHDKEGLAE